MSRTDVSWELSGLEFQDKPQQPRVKVVSGITGGVELLMRLGDDGETLKRYLTRDEVVWLSKVLAFASECE